MPGRARDVLWAAAAAVNGAAGIAASRCTGGTCTRCFACAVPAAGVLLFALVGARRKATPDRAGEGADDAVRPAPG